MSSRSRTEVSVQLSLGLVGPEHTIVPLTASLSYTSADPYAVVITFHVDTDDPVEWTLARDLLAAALHSREGIGDVQAWPSAAGSVLNLAMSSPYGDALFEIPAADVARLLERAYALVPAGTETGFIDFDAELTRLLSRPLPPGGGTPPGSFRLLSCRGRVLLGTPRYAPSGGFLRSATP